MPSNRFELKPPAGDLTDVKIDPLMVLIRHEGQHMVAQCLQYDFAVQGRTFRELQERMAHLLTSQVMIDLSMGKSPLKGTPKAPDFYWHEWENGSRVAPAERGTGDGDAISKHVKKAVTNANFAMT